MIRSLDHIAIAVDDLDEGIKRFMEDFGIPMTSREDVPSQSTTTAFFPIPGTRIELVHPMNGEGPLVRHLAKRGPGIHHICFRTDDVHGDMEGLKGLGYRFTSEEPTPGAHNALVAFIHPKSTGGVLIELAQYPDEVADDAK